MEKKTFNGIKAYESKVIRKKVEAFLHIKKILFNLTNIEFTLISRAFHSAFCVL